MTGIPHSVHVRELRHRDLHIRELEAEVNRQANVISHLADKWVVARNLLQRINLSIDDGMIEFDIPDVGHAFRDAINASLRERS